MLLQFPRSLHYPITITALLKTPGDEVQKFTPLVQYKYLTFVMEDDDMTREPVRVEKWFPAMWESPITGTLKRWMIEVGSVVESGKYVLVRLFAAVGFPPIWGCVA